MGAGTLVPAPTTVFVVRARRGRGRATERGAHGEQASDKCDVVAKEGLHDLDNSFVIAYGRRFFALVCQVLSISESLEMKKITAKNVPRLRFGKPYSRGSTTLPNPLTPIFFILKIVKTITNYRIGYQTQKTRYRNLLDSGLEHARGVLLR